MSAWVQICSSIYNNLRLQKWLNKQNESKIRKSAGRRKMRWTTFNSCFSCNKNTYNLFLSLSLSPHTHSRTHTQSSVSVSFDKHWKTSNQNCKTSLHRITPFLKHSQHIPRIFSNYVQTHKNAPTRTQTHIHSYTPTRTQKFLLILINRFFFKFKNGL